MNKFDSKEMPGGDLPNFKEVKEILEVPSHLDILTDGRETLIIGDTQKFADFNHRQGDNPYGFLGTCGLVSCEDVLKQFGLDTTETSIIEYAIENGLCSIGLNPTLVSPRAM